MRELAARLGEAARARLSAFEASSSASASSAAAAAAADAAAHNPIAARLDGALETLSSGLVERDAEVRLLLLAVLSGEHLLLLGRPGTAKSALARRLGSAVGGAFFERLLTRFSVPEELFGPLSLSALEADRYERRTDGYLPAASVAFLDEIFKANSSILNALLTLLNERAFDNGAGRRAAPLICLVAASNEAPESAELDALYDRFLLRRCVPQLSSQGIRALLEAPMGLDDATEASSSGSAGASGDAGAGVGAGVARVAGAGGSAARGAESNRPALFDLAELEAFRSAAHAGVEVGAGVKSLLEDLREWVQESRDGYISDRRMLRALRLLQVAAHACGRRAVSLQDCLLLQHCMWANQEDALPLKQWLLVRVAQPNGPRLRSASSAPQDPQDQRDFLGTQDTLVEQDTLTAADAEITRAFEAVCRAGCAERPADAASHSPNGGSEEPKESAALGRLSEALEAEAAAAAQVAARAQPEAVGNRWMTRAESAESAAAAARGAQSRRDAALSLLKESYELQGALQARAPPQAAASLLPSRWMRLAKDARERAFERNAGRLRGAIPPCGHRVARASCEDCLVGMGLLVEEQAGAGGALPEQPRLRARGDLIDQA